jgi:hypothetical protein
MLFPLMLLVPMLAAQGPPPPGPPPPPPVFHDDLLEQMVGVWAVTGTESGQPLRRVATVDWAMNHQFLRIHQREMDGSYESEIFIGYDNLSARYIAHVLDTNGARRSQTPGYGIRIGDKIQFTFDYSFSSPNAAPLIDTLSWDSKEKTWQFVLEFKDKQGPGRHLFAAYTLRRLSGFVDRGPRGRGGPPR